jgi:hypothetical protein
MINVLSSSSLYNLVLSKNKIQSQTLLAATYIQQLFFFWLRFSNFWPEGKSLYYEILAKY